MGQTEDVEERIKIICSKESSMLIGKITHILLYFILMLHYSSHTHTPIDYAVSLLITITN